MDHCRDGASPPSAVKRRTLPDVPWVSLAEALTWIAFGDAMTTDDLQAQVEGHRAPTTDSPEGRLRKFFAGHDEDMTEVPGLGYFHDRQVGLDRLTEAWRQTRDEIHRGTFKMRGRFTPTYSLADARLADAEELTGNLVATFSQFDVSTGGIRRQPEGSPDIMWQDDPHSFDREIEAFGDDARAADGYLLVEVERARLMKTHRERERREVPANRSLNHDEIIGQAASMLAAQPGISKGSAAASIVADLPHNPRTGKPRDTRHIERMIAHLWEGGGLSQSPR